MSSLSRSHKRWKKTIHFGDDWEHDILVENVLDRDEAVSYPRCTDGRRAAPSEDCPTGFDAKTVDPDPVPPMLNTASVRGR